MNKTGRARIVVPKKLGVTGFLWCLYLGSAPVFWLPGFSASTIQTSKHLLIYLAVGATAAVSIFKRSVHLPWGIAGLSGFGLILVLSIPAVFLSELSIGLSRIVDLLYAATAFSSFFFLTRAGYDVEKILKISAFIISGFAAYSLVGMFGSLSWRQPADLGFFDVSTAGFGGLRTGWSNGLSLYIAFSLAWVYSKDSLIKFNRSLLAITMAGTIFISQYMVGGRAGLLASLVSLVVLAHYLIPPANRVLVYVIFSAVVVAAAGQAVYEHLRIDRLVSNESLDVDTLDHFSANRITTYRFAFKKISEKPLFGHGFGNANVVGGSEIHNVWLKHGAEAGLLFLAAELLFVLKFMLPFPRPKRIQSSYVVFSRQARLYAFCWAALLSGLVISMLEPRMLFGSFQTSAIWWCAAGVLVAIQGKSHRAVFQ